MHFKILIGLPLRVIDDTNFNYTVFIFCFHADELAKRMVILTSDSCSIYSLDPEAECLVSLFFNCDCNVTVALRDLVLQVLEGHGLTLICYTFLVELSLSLFALVEANKVSLSS